MVTHSNSKSSTSGSTDTAAAKPLTKTRKPPVAERVTVSAVVAVPQAGPAATPPPTQAPAPVATPAGSPVGSPPAGASSPGGGGAPLPATPVVAPPPATIPAVPSGFVPANPADFKGFRAMASQVAAVPDAITELQGFTGYTSVFGITAPDAAQLIQRLNVAYQWTMLLSQTAAWYKYAKSQQGMAWKDAVILVDALKAPFDLAAAANPALLSQYPAIARLLGAKAVVAKRSAATKAKNKKADAQKAATAAAETTPMPPPAAAPSAGGTTSNAAPNGAGASTPMRIVTVQG